MEQAYFDSLERIGQAAKILQAHPVPDSEERCNQLDGHVQKALDALRTAMLLVQGHGSLWCGEPDDPLRQGMVLAKDWDYVFNARRNKRAK